MSAANDKVSKEAMGLVVEFLSPNKGKFNGTNNYFAWAAAMHTTLGARYGPMARVFTDQVPYVLPDIEIGDLPQVGDPGMEGLTIANINAIRVSVITDHAKKKREMRDEQPKFFNDILLKISVASQLLIEADGEWAAAKAAEDPNALVAIIHRTHFTHVGGATPAMAKINMQKSFNALEQGPSRSISEFKKEFDTLLRCMRGAGIPEMDGETLAIWFLEKLDQVRHGSMVLYLTNGRAAGQAFPATADEAYTIAKDWKSSTVRAADFRGIIANGSVFMLADEVRALVVTPSSSRPARKKNQPAAEERVRNPTRPKTDAELSPREARQRARTCYRCGEPGHAIRNCPQRALTAIEAEAITRDEADDAADQAALYAAMYAADLALVSADYALFAPEEVIFDTAASKSVFMNPNLLTNVVPSASPTVIGGVQQDAPGVRIDDVGNFRDLGEVGIGKGAACNILSACQMLDTGRTFKYDDENDEFIVSGPSEAYVFARRLRPDGSKTRFYTRDFAYVATVAENLRRYSVREVKQMEKAAQLARRLGHATSKAVIGIINSGVMNCPVSATDVRNNDAAKGVSVAGLLGKTAKKGSISPGYVLAPRVTQVQQILNVDVIFIKKIAFLLGVFTPLGLGLVHFLRDRSESQVATALRLMLAKAASRSFDVIELRCDGEGAIGALTSALQASGITVSIAGPGQHVAVVERMARTLKNRYRCHELALPFVMTHTLIVWCVLFCMHSVNLQPNASSVDKVSPYEQFSGLKLDAKRDLRVGFGDYAIATNAMTDNSMGPRAGQFIALGGKGGPTGSVWMLSLRSNQVVTRDQFVILPMPDIVVKKITEQAHRQGYTRGEDPTLESPEIIEDETNDGRLPEMMTIDGRDDARQEPARHEIATDAEEIAPPAGVSVAAQVQAGPLAPEASTAPVGSRELRALRRDAGFVEPSTAAAPEQSSAHQGVRWSRRLSPRATSEVLLTREKMNAVRAMNRRHLILQGDRDTLKEHAFKISVNTALRERGDEARPVILAELKQMMEKHVWHGVLVSDLTRDERDKVIRCSMFLKEKFTASGEYEKLKARLVAGGDQQDKGLYEDLCLSSPTASTTSVLAIAAIAACEGRSVTVMDIGGAFLNADITSTGIKVHMRLNRVLTDMLVQIDPKHARYVEDRGTSVVVLDKALYGCVEAAALWHANLCATMESDGFASNPYDSCVFNKHGLDGAQVTVVMHVDDLFITSKSDDNHTNFESCMRNKYKEIKVSKGKILDYIGMTFDFIVPGQVSITMDNCERSILSEGGVWPLRSTPAASTLFDTRDAPKATKEEVQFFRTFVAKLLYLAKRVRPECLVAVAFLTTRVHDVDADDMGKLKRLLGYLRATPNRGVVLRVGNIMTVRAFIDASYGVHASSGKSHTGCAIVLGEAGVLSARSSKQKIVTKSSTEAELVGLSDSAAQAIHLKNCVSEQGYSVGPVVIYQDNLSCMALMKRGGPGSERSRHINIRHFWVAERVTNGDVVIEHLSTNLMHANVLTKPVQGAQFERERMGLTNWA